MKGRPALPTLLRCRVELGNWRQLNLLIRFPRIAKNPKTLILSGPKNGGAYNEILNVMAKVSKEKDRLKNVSKSKRKVSKVLH